MKNELQRARVAFWHYRTGGRKGFSLWRDRQNAERGLPSADFAEGAQGAWVGRGRKRRLTFKPTEVAELRSRRDLEVAAILDEFSWNAFSPEWKMTALTPGNWRILVDRGDTELVFVESAWNGSNGAWKYHLTGSKGPSNELREAVAAFKAAGIPTVFWNKEDPAHFDDFLETARLFDLVFTTDSDMIPRYMDALAHDRVFHLGFAAQPAIHNPVRPRRGWHARGVGFGGMYFSHKFPERREQLRLLLSAAIQDQADGRRLEIFSRMLDGQPEYQFPQPFDHHVVGSLSYKQMLTAYKAYKVFLNVNSVITSPTMCARRVFEISASGTPVVSTPSRAIGSTFARGEVAVVQTEDEARAVIGSLLLHPELGDRQVHLAQRRIWGEHTYSHRVERILSSVLTARANLVPEPSLSVLVSTMRPHQLEHVFRTVNSQSVQAELVLLTHGFEASRDLLDSLSRKYPVAALHVLTAPASVSLGACLNNCVAAASGDVLTKMDDDDYYAPEYLQDQLNARMYSGAEVVGKQCHYMYLGGPDCTVLRFPDREHRYTSKVMGPTIMAARDLFRAYPFADLTMGEDSNFLGRVAGEGNRLYSSDRFNYCQLRRSSGHTWSVSEHELALTGRFIQFGSPEDFITL